MASSQSFSRCGPATYQGSGRPPAPRRGNRSASATSAAVAQKDIWKPGSATATGCSARTIRAAAASDRRLMARRSHRMARKATAAVIAARRAGG